MMKTGKRLGEFRDIAKPCDTTSSFDMFDKDGVA